MCGHGETADKPLRKSGRLKVVFGFARAVTRPPLRSHPTSGNFMMSMAQDRESWIEAFRQMQAHTATGPLQISLVDVDADTITLRMPITNASRQPMGLLHGGVSMVLAETAASMHSCWGLDLSRFYPVGIEINGSHLRSARDGHVLAKASIVRRTRTLVVHSIEIVHEETGDLLCTSRVTNLIREHRP